MTRLRIVVTATAESQIRTIERWWATERTASPGLFADELEAVIDQIALAPLSGAPYSAAPITDVRRALMPRTRYHVYYSQDEHTDTLVLRAVWHSARGSGPQLR